MSGEQRTGASKAVDVAFDVPARMRDGVTLKANVYRPSGAESLPVLLMRTPYGKDAPEVAGWTGVDPLQTARRGFIVVVQDTRGRFASEGEWDPFRWEGQDGHDSVEWAARLPGSNGRVGMFGGSYHGNTQWAAAATAPPSLGAISPALTWSDPMDGLFARGGAVELGLALMWALSTGMDLSHRGLDGDATQAVEARLIDEWDRLHDDGYWSLPVGEGMPLERHRVLDVGALRVLEDPTIADACRVRDMWDSVEVPTLHMAGWYDIFQQGTLDNFVAMRERVRDARLVVGPWSHNDFGDPIGDRIFGMRADRDHVSLHPSEAWGDLQGSWFDRHLRPDVDPGRQAAPVRIFLMGRNVWRDEDSWPVQGAEDRRFFLRAGRGLDEEGPGPGEGSSAFTYDPLDPVPTTGGNGVLSPAFRSGPTDQRAIEGRPDVLVFTSQMLADDLVVIGRIRVVLHARSSAPSTDWVARLCDVFPDGRSVNICDGIVRVEEGADDPTAVEVDLWSTANVFERGHRLRLHVTSSSFPRWDRNLNTGDQRADATRSAEQTVHHAAAAPSFLELPVIPNVNGV